MLNYHTTKDGKRMLICEMADSHLVNLINQRINQLFAIKIYIEKPNLFNDKLIQRMYRQQRIDEATALELVPQLINSLYPYLAEAWFRRLDVTDEIQQKFESVLGRKGRLIMTSDTTLRLLDSVLKGESDDEGGAEDNDEDPLETWGDR